MSGSAFVCWARDKAEVGERIDPSKNIKRFQVRHKTHVSSWRRDHTNLIFLNRGNAENEELLVTPFLPGYPPLFADLIKPQWKGASTW